MDELWKGRACRALCRTPKRIGYAQSCFSVVPGGFVQVGQSGHVAGWSPLPVSEPFTVQRRRWSSAYPGKRRYDEVRFTHHFMGKQAALRSRQSSVASIALVLLRWTSSKCGYGDRHRTTFGSWGISSRDKITSTVWFPKFPVMAWDFHYHRDMQSDENQIWPGGSWSSAQEANRDVVKYPRGACSGWNANHLGPRNGEMVRGLGGQASTIQGGSSMG